MSQLTALQDKYLTNASRKLMNEEARYISTRVLSPVTVKQTTGLIGAYDKEHLRIVNTVMGGRGKAPRFEVGTKSSNQYKIEKHGLSQIITEEEYDNYAGTPFEVEMDSVMDLLSVIWLGREKGLADTLTNASVLTQNQTLSGGSQWSDYANSDPLNDFKTARNTIMDNAGVKANKAILPWKVFENLRYHPQILENLGFTRARAGQMKASEMAAALDVDELFIPSAVYNNADRGQSDAVSQVWGNDAIFLYAPSQPRLRDQSLGFNVQRKAARQVFKNKIDNPPGS
jgi:hypothetical protein